MRSYRPEELFDEAGHLAPEIAALGSSGDATDGRKPARERGAAQTRARASGLGRAYAVDVPRPGAMQAEATRLMGVIFARCRAPQCRAGTSA